MLFFSINAKFFEHCNPSLLTTLKENMVSIDEKWSKVHESLSEKLVIARKQDPNDEELAAIVDDLDELEVSESRKLSSMSQEDAPLFEEFRTAFQEISDWISRAESKLGTNRGIIIIVFQLFFYSPQKLEGESKALFFLLLLLL